MKQRTTFSVAQDEPELRRALESTARFYDSHAAEYFRRTVDADLSSIYDRFFVHVPDAGRILDAGCGSGRDLREFVQRGYRATGIDSSRELVKLAERYSSAPCQVMRLEALSFTNRFEAIWACASLLHLPKSMLSGALRRLRAALVPRGVMFASVQIGEGESLGPDGRLFAYFSKPEFVDALSETGFQPLDVWISEDKLPGREKVAWVNVIARRAKSGPARDE